jgi:hypothetical protein
MMRTICLSWISALLYTLCPASAGFCSGCTVLSALSAVSTMPMKCASCGSAATARSTATGTALCRISASSQRASSLADGSAP